MDTPHMFPEKQIGLPTLNAVDHLDPVAYLHRENCAMHHSRLLLVRSGHFTMNMANAQYELAGGDLMFTPAELPYAYTTGKDARLSNLYFYLPETFAPDNFRCPLPFRAIPKANRSFSALVRLTWSSVWGMFLKNSCFYLNCCFVFSGAAE